ncbi:hypothetical protein GCM10010909_01510 [Acidocella aquatica]|uniref:Flavodoxin n=1 Tax=Acidocella aquatica TaxID=1922313 RepID=A0ABQ6A247_9PROT|nr:hypothetical protein [Acidocella aquatica]GLR65473.1 hypothetical protein GCM10010909_01510 [Acidocella aquatica]
MRCLLLYYSLTGQAARAVDLAAQACAQQGWEAVACRMDFASPGERPARPLGIAGSKKWTQGAQRGMTLPLVYEPAAAVGEAYDLVLIFSNTWGGSPSVPVRSFLESGEARRLLAGKPFGVFVICRRLFEKNLALTRSLGEAAGGRFLGGEAFMHPGGQIGSLIQTVTYINRAGPPLRRFLGFPLPAYGLSDEALARVPVFTRALLERV